MRILIITGHVLNRLWRQKLLIVTFGVALLIIGFVSSPLFMIKMATEAGQLSEAQQAAAGMFLLVTTLMGWFAGLVGLIIGVTVTRQDIRDATIFSLLAKPVARWEYLLGSYLGSVIYLLLVWVVLAAVYVGLVYVTEQPLGRIHGLVILGHAALSLLMLSLAFGLAQHFSAWIAALLGVVIYNGDAAVNALVSLLGLIRLRMPEWMSKALTFPLPATNCFDPLFESLAKIPLQPPPWGWGFLHIIDYSAVMVLLGWGLFRRQDVTSATE